MFYSKAHTALALNFLESGQNKLKEKFFESRKQYQLDLNLHLNISLRHYLHLLNIACKKIYISEFGKLIQQRNEISRVNRENQRLHAVSQSIWQSLPGSHRDKDSIGGLLKLSRPEPLSLLFEAESKINHQLYRDFINDLINNQGKGFYKILEQYEGKKQISTSSPKKGNLQNKYPLFEFIDKIELLFKVLSKFDSPRKINLERICQIINDRYKNHPQLSSPQLCQQEKYVLFYAKSILKTTLTLKKPTLWSGFENEPITVLNIKAARSQLAEYTQLIMPLEENTDDEDWTVIDGFSM